MFNVTIVKLKDIVKLIIIIISIYILSRFVFKNISIKDYLTETISFNTSDIIKLGINSESNVIKDISKIKDIKENTTEIEDIKDLSIKSILHIGLNIFEARELISDKLEFKERMEENRDEESIEVTQNNEAATNDIVNTQVVTKNPLQDKFNIEYNGVKIKNETSYELTEDVLNFNDLKIQTENIIIFHTHTCESYSQSDNYKYTSSGNYRTTDLNYSVARVGLELANQLSAYGFNINHNTNLHDYPSYTGSYTRSLSTVKNILDNFNSDIIIDLHRDAIGSDENYAPLVKIGEDYCAQLMFVIGTDGGGLSHQNWNSNLKFAMKVQEKANELYPGLFKPIILRNSRYNQHLGKAACIIEVGATGNNLEQTLTSMKYLAKVINESLV